jgi:ABC-type antimicrobial peptide transport system permease subunit
VAIINETTARQFWPNESPIGKRIHHAGPQRVYYEIVGVVNDLDYPGVLEEAETPFQAFVPATQAAPDAFTIILRTSSTPEAITNPLRSLIAGLDSQLPVYGIRTVRKVVDQALGDLSLLGSLLGAFAAIGLILAAIGIYGIVSYVVVQRTGELGIRMALGAQTRQVLWLVLSKGVLLIGIGALLGGVAAYGVSKVLISLIPSLPTYDPVILPLAVLVLAAVALVACYIPARRATRVDPLLALKSE